MGGGGIVYAGEPPQDGLVADWRFAEGSGTTVADETGTYPIDLTAAVAPTNVTWEAHGVSCDAGAIKTPVVTNMRTVVQLYRVPKDELAKFTHSGPQNIGLGPYDQYLFNDTTYTTGAWVGQGYGVHAMKFDPAANGRCPEHLVGGWRMFIREFPAAYTGFITFNSNGGSTAGRYTEYDLAWAAMYDRVLTDEDRATLFSFARGLSVERGVYICPEDCPTQADLVLVWGGGNADGTALIADMALSDQSRTYAKTKIAMNTISATSNKAFNTLALGSNHRSSGTTQMGVEIYLANAREDTAGARDLYIMKMAQLNTWVVPSSDPAIAQNFSWSPEEYVTWNGFWARLVTPYQYLMSAALGAGIGLNLRGFIADIGDKEIASAGPAADFEQSFSDFMAALDAWIGDATYKVVIPRVAYATGAPPAYYSTVRTAQANVAAALGSRATLVDTDAMEHDYAYFTETGIHDFADAAAVALFGSGMVTPSGPASESDGWFFPYYAFGDSLTAGTTSHAGQLVTYIDGPGRNLAVSGHDLIDMDAVVDGVVSEISGMVADGRTVVASVMIGRNDVTAFVLDWEAYLDDVKVTVAKLKAAGATVIMGTLLPCDVAGWNAAKASYNAQLEADEGTWFDYLADYRTTTTGTDGSESNPTYYSDGTHPTQAGQDELYPVLLAAWQSAVASVLP